MTKQFSVIIELEKLKGKMTVAIQQFETKRKLPESLSMSQDEYKKNWADWKKAVEVRQIIQSTIWDIERALKQVE